MIDLLESRRKRISQDTIATVWWGTDAEAAQTRDSVIGLFPMLSLPRLFLLGILTGKWCLAILARPITFFLTIFGSGQSSIHEVRQRVEVTLMHNEQLASAPPQRTRYGWILQVQRKHSENPLHEPLGGRWHPYRFVSHRTGKVFVGFCSQESYREMLYLFEQQVAPESRKRRDGKKVWCLIVEGDSKDDTNVHATRYSVKCALGLPYERFREIEERIPGPLFRGERSSLEWLAGRFREEDIPCVVRKVPPRQVAGLERFHMTYRELSAADAYADQASMVSAETDSHTHVGVYPAR